MLVFYFKKKLSLKSPERGLHFKYLEHEKSEGEENNLGNSNPIVAELVRLPHTWKYDKINLWEEPSEN